MAFIESVPKQLTTRKQKKKKLIPHNYNKKKLHSPSFLSQNVFYSINQQNQRSKLIIRELKYLFVSWFIFKANKNQLYIYCCNLDFFFLCGNL